MKWIGQQIYDFISRFRNDVYLENISTGTIASGGNLGLDSNNKIVKADTEAGELSITNATNDRIITSTGGTGLNAESLLTFDGLGLLSLSSSTGSLPILHILNNVDNAESGVISLNNTRGGNNGADNDETGQINFIGQDDGGQNQTFAEIRGFVADATAGQEAGRLEFRVAEFDGSFNVTGLTIDGDTNVDGQIDVTIGAGTSSTTTITGGLTMGSTAFANNSGVIQVATQGTIDHNSLANFVAAEHVDWASATAGTIHRTNIPTLDQDTTGQAGTVATITGLAPDTATTQATQPNITSLGTLTNLQVDSVNINNKAIEIQGDTGDTFNITTGAAGATTLTTTDAAAAAGHFEIAADGDITLDAAGNIALETNGGQLTCDAAGYTFSSSGGERPAFTIQNAANDATGPTFTISNIRDGNGLTDGDSLGTINFSGEDAAGGSEGYATIQGLANETANGDECGTLSFQVANNGTLKEGIVISADSGTTSEVDVQIGNGVVSTTTIAGYLESTGRVTIKNGDYLYFNDDDNSHATRVIGSTTSTNRTITLPDATGTVALNNISYHQITANFFDTLGTTAHYIPLGDSISEVTSDLNTITDWIAPCETTVDSIIMRMTNIIATADITFTVQKDAVGSSSTADVEAETLNVGSTNEHDVLFFKFDSATIAKGETLKIKIQCASSMTSSTNHFVRVNLIMNWDDRYTGSSQIFTS